MQPEDANWCCRNAQRPPRINLEQVGQRCNPTGRRTKSSSLFFEGGGGLPSQSGKGPCTGSNSDSALLVDGFGCSAQDWVGGTDSDCKGFSWDQRVHSPISSACAAALVGSDSCVASSASCQGLSAPIIDGVGCQVWPLGVSLFGGIIAITAAKELRLLWQNATGTANRVQKKKTYCHHHVRSQVYKKSGFETKKSGFETKRP